MIVIRMMEYYIDEKYIKNIYYFSSRSVARNRYSDDCALLKSVHVGWAEDLLIYSEGEHNHHYHSRPLLPPFSCPFFHPDNQRWEARASLSSTTLTISNPRRGSLAKLQLMPFLQQVVGELSRHAWPIACPVACIMQKKEQFVSAGKFAKPQIRKKERERGVNRQRYM